MGPGLGRVRRNLHRKIFFGFLPPLKIFLCVCQNAGYFPPFGASRGHWSVSRWCRHICQAASSRLKERLHKCHSPEEEVGPANLPRASATLKGLPSRPRKRLRRSGQAFIVHGTSIIGLDSTRQLEHSFFLGKKSCLQTFYKLEKNGLHHFHSWNMNIIYANTNIT